MLADTNKPTTDSVMAGEGEGRWCGLKAHVGGPGRVLGSRKLGYHRVKGEGQGNNFPEGAGKPDDIFPRESFPPVDGNLNLWMPQSPGTGATAKSKVGLAPPECSSCLDLRSLARTQRLENALHPVLDRVNCRQQLCQRQSLPAFFPIQDTTPAHPQPTRPGSRPGWCCLHSLGGAAQQGRADSLHRWYYHFLTIHKKERLISI